MQQINKGCQKTVNASRHDGKEFCKNKENCMEARLKGKEKLIENVGARFYKITLLCF